MDALDGTWVPTERTHPLYFAILFGSDPIIAAVLVYLWFEVLVPQYGTRLAVLTVLIVAVGSALISAYFWAAILPVAIRVSRDGVEIRRRLGRVLKIPAEGLVIRARAPFGFGAVSFPGGSGFMLSPNQFAAVRRLFPFGRP
ncbi:MAG TPA: hypothetical protein VFF67_10080 [Thermoplasmata archaeon]|nr:hypothetical protein [Thermoplasmata archaeon]